MSYLWQKEQTLLLFLSLLLVLLFIFTFRFLLLRFKEKLLHRFKEKIWITFGLFFAYALLYFFLLVGIKETLSYTAGININELLERELTLPLLYLAILFFALSMVLLLAIRSLLKALFKLLHILFRGDPGVFS